MDARGLLTIAALTTAWYSNAGSTIWWWRRAFNASYMIVWASMIVMRIRRVAHTCCIGLKHQLPFVSSCILLSAAPIDSIWEDIFLRVCSNKSMHVLRSAILTTGSTVTWVVISYARAKWQEGLHDWTHAHLWVDAHPTPGFHLTLWWDVHQMLSDFHLLQMCYDCMVVVGHRCHVCSYQNSFHNQDHLRHVGDCARGVMVEKNWVGYSHQSSHASFDSEWTVMEHMPCSAHRNVEYNLENGIQVKALLGGWQLGKRWRADRTGKSSGINCWHR